MKVLAALSMIFSLLVSCYDGNIRVDFQEDTNYITKVQYTTSYLFNFSYFKVRPFSSSAQGMDLYDDKFLFQAGLLGSTIYIFDIDSFRMVGSIVFDVPNGESSHMNNINCGPRYDNSDKWPLLYLSQTVDSHKCYVLRLSDDATSYTLLQTIQYKGTHHYVDSLYDWFVDTQNDFIYAYGYLNGNKEERDIVKFPLPSLDCSEIIFTDDDILDNFTLKNMSIFQGSKIVDNLLYVPVGYGDSTFPGYIKVISLDEKRLVINIPISCGEPESVGQYKDGLIICGGGMSPDYYFFQL